jgi:hypothetical protein
LLNEVEQGGATHFKAQLIGYLLGDNDVLASRRIGKLQKLAGHHILAHGAGAVLFRHAFEHHAQHLISGFNDGRFAGKGLYGGYLGVAGQLAAQLGLGDGGYLQRIVGVVARELQMRTEREYLVLNLLPEAMQD